MKTKIKFDHVEDIANFVSIANQCDFDVDVQYRHFILDGKSLVGLMNIDLTNPLIVYSKSTNPVFEAMLKKHAI